MDEPACEIARIRARGLGPACGRPATWVYINGDYRRLECDRHAELTRGYMRQYAEGPQPTLTPLARAALAG